MKILITILFLSLLSSSCSVPNDDLVYRDGVYYKKFSEVPFTGKVTGLRNGLMKNGKEDGEWVINHENGQLYSKGNYKNGKREGSWVWYYDNGQLFSKGNYKNGEDKGEWVWYHIYGHLDSKGNYKNGKKEGAWVEYEKDGTLYRERSGTYKNGMKVSD